MRPNPEDQKAPKRIWLCPQNYEAATACGHPSDTEYVRADLFASAIATERAAEREKVWKAVHAVPTYVRDNTPGYKHDRAKSVNEYRKDVLAAIRAGDKSNET